MDDQGSEASARSSLEDLLKSMNKWPVKDASELELDASGDPEPRSASSLNTSLQTLISGPESSTDVGVRQQSVSVSTSAVTEQQSIRLTSCDDDFFEMVSRLQSKRLNDQRCDPIILSDLTNHSKNITRQSDTIVCNPGEAETHLGRRRRLSALFGRVGKSARRQSLLMSASFFPSTTSTPRSSTCSSKQRPLVGSGHRFQDSSRATSATTLHLQRTISDAAAQNAKDVDDATSDWSKTSLTTGSPEFRVPVAPPRNRARKNRAVPLNSSVSLNSKNGAEGMLELIVSLQGRRMEEQRAHLSVQPDTISLSVSNNDDAKNDEESVEQPPRVERSRSEDAGSLYEMVIRSQRDRLDEQRSELPRTIPAEDVSQIVMSMQKGRIETQRAALSSSSQN